jgi:hypothetical protein
VAIDEQEVVEPELADKVPQNRMNRAVDLRVKAPVTGVIQENFFTYGVRIARDVEVLEVEIAIIRRQVVGGFKLSPRRRSQQREELVIIEGEHCLTLFLTQFDVEHRLARLRI